MTSMYRNLACALAVSMACGAISSAVFSAALAVLPHPRLVAEALVHRPMAQPVRIESTVAATGAALAGS